eukprot:SAG25_NODE_5239_length_684_cov_0.859829_2_plen_160_part_01
MPAVGSARHGTHAGRPAGRQADRRRPSPRQCTLAHARSRHRHFWAGPGVTCATRVCTHRAGVGHRAPEHLLEVGSQHVGERLVALFGGVCGARHTTTPKISTQPLPAGQDQAGLVRRDGLAWHACVRACVRSGVHAMHQLTCGTATEIPSILKPADHFLV